VVQFVLPSQNLLGIPRSNLDLDGKLVNLALHLCQERALSGVKQQDYNAIEHRITSAVVVI
jgi:hypothetical protein